MQVRRLENGVVDIAQLEKVPHQPVAALIQVLVVVPDFGLRTEVGVVGIKAIDELLAVDISLILRPGVPQSNVGVHDEIALVVLGVQAYTPRFGVTPVTQT